MFQNLIETVYCQVRAERVPGTGNGPAGNSPTRYRRVSGYDPFLTTGSFVAQLGILDRDMRTLPHPV